MQGETIQENMDRLDLSHPQVSTEERRTLRFLHRLVDEAQSFKDDIGISSRSDRVREFMVSAFSRKVIEEKPHRSRINLNKIRSVLTRQAGMLTESRPSLDVKSKAGRREAAETLKMAIEGIWNERNFQQAITQGIVFAQKYGYASCYVPWDEGLDFGRGDVNLQFMNPKNVLFDPQLESAAQLQQSDYMIMKRVMPLPRFREMYGRRGAEVKPDQDLSTFENMSMHGVQSPMAEGMYAKFRKPSRREKSRVKGAVARAIETRVYMRDYSVNPEQPWITDNATATGHRPNYIFPGKRLLVYAGDRMLYDGPSRYWDGMYPMEILGWGIETDHPYGESEVERLMQINKAMNWLTSGVVDNARLINDPPWKVEQNAMPPTDLQNLKRKADQPGYPIIHRKGYMVERDPPGAMTPVVMNVLEFLEREMQVDSGMVDVTQGVRPPSLQSGIAIDSLLLAAQIVIRLQARAIEDFLARVGQLVISRVIQFYEDRRIFRGYGADQDVMEFAYSRQKFLQQIAKEETQEQIESRLQDLFADFRFYVVPKSGLAIAVQQKQQLYGQLNADGKLADIEVLKVANIPDPEDKLEAAREDILKKAALQGQAAMMAQGGPPPGGPGGPGGPPPGDDAPQTPAIQSAGAGASQTDNQAGGAQNVQRPNQQAS